MTSTTRAPSPLAPTSRRRSRSLSNSDNDVKRDHRSPRLRRLFRPESGRSLVVALDHGFFAVPADLPAIEDLAGVVDTVTGIEPDGVLMSAGQARLLGDVAGRSLPALTVRCDVTNLYLSPPRADAASCVADAALRAVRARRRRRAGQPARRRRRPDVRLDCLRNVFDLKAQCEQFGHADDGRADPDGAPRRPLLRRRRRGAASCRSCVRRSRPGPR